MLWSFFYVTKDEILPPFTIILLEIIDWTEWDTRECDNCDIDNSENFNICSIWTDPGQLFTNDTGNCCAEHKCVQDLSLMSGCVRAAVYIHPLRGHVAQWCRHTRRDSAKLYKHFETLPEQKQSNRIDTESERDRVVLGNISLVMAAMVQIAWHRN